jgi:hypothetical protein
MGHLVRRLDIAQLSTINYELSTMKFEYGKTILSAVTVVALAASAGGCFLWGSDAPRIIARPAFPPSLDAEIDGPLMWCDAHPSWGKAPLKVYFSVELLEPAAPDAWAWDFGDGSAIARLRTPDHVYKTPGVYEAHVWVRDRNGKIGMDTVKVRVE